MSSNDNPYATPEPVGEATTRPAVSEAGGELNNFVSPMGRYEATRFVIVVYAIIVIICLVSSTMQFSLLEEARGVKGPDFAERAEANDQREGIVAIVQIVWFVVCGIVSLRLLHRLRSNVDHLGAKRLDASPNWTIGYFFVPILNLWKPFEAVKQTFQASANPRMWRSRGTPSSIGIWWALWIVSSLLSRFIARFSGDSVDQLIYATMLEIVIEFLSLATAYFYLTTLWAITDTQIDTWEKLAKKSATPVEAIA